MDSHQYGHSEGCPPLLPMEMMGTLQSTNYGTIEPEISGNIHLGRCQSQDGKWTCYRRNYLTCICSFSLSPIHREAMIQFTPTPMSGTSNTPTLQVCSFAMSISVVDAENEQQAIELVQYTSKRDNGPTSKPRKILIAPSNSATPHDPSPGINDSGLSSSQSLYAVKSVGQTNIGQEVPDEIVFERIQFKKATQNNGKRRSGQQYYRLVVELWADTGAQAADRFVKVAIRKSAKMIVCGRSRGHYQNKLGISQSSGTGSAVGSRFRCTDPVRACLGSYNSGHNVRNTNYVGQQEIFLLGQKGHRHLLKVMAGESTGLIYRMSDTLHFDVHNNATNERKIKPRIDFNYYGKFLPKNVLLASSYSDAPALAGNASNEGMALVKT